MNIKNDQALMRLLAGFVLILFTIISGAAEANRLALVIGNNDYEVIPKLQKAVNDANAISDALLYMGFDVIKANDVGFKAMSRAIVDLESKINKGDVALVFFAGHGLAIEGTNYLLPLDTPNIKPGEEGLIKDSSFAVNNLADRIRNKGADISVLIIDACRDNPFEQPGKRSIGLSRGLARVDPAEGIFILFSAGQGQSALDRLSDADNNKNSVFTRILLQELDSQNLSMVQIAKNVQIKVKNLAAKIDHNQVPAYYDQIIGDLNLTSIGKQGSLNVLKEGTASVLPSSIDDEYQSNPAPLVSFDGFDGWDVSISIPEAAQQIGYRIGETGSFKDLGLSNEFDHKTGLRIPNNQFEMPASQKDVTIYVTWKDKRGEQAEIYPVKFDRMAEVVRSGKRVLQEMTEIWVNFDGPVGKGKASFPYFSFAPCAIKEVLYGFDDEPVTNKLRNNLKCNPDEPLNASRNFMVAKITPNASKINVRVVFADNTESETVSFDIPK